MADSFEYYHEGLQYVRARPHVPILPIEHLPSFNAHGRHPGIFINNAQDGMGEGLASDYEGTSNDTVLTWGRRDGRILRDAIIQGGVGLGLSRSSWPSCSQFIPTGNFDPSRRDYENFLLDLEAEIQG
jgi:hypothetical protein